MKTRLGCEVGVTLFLPFCFFTIRVSTQAFKAFILYKKGYIPHPQSLGEHLRNRRLVLGMRQEDVAGQIGPLREVYEGQMHLYGDQNYRLTTPSPLPTVPSQ